MDGLDLQKIEISGPTLASLIQRVSSSPADADGLLFGHVSVVTPSTLYDDSSPDPAASSTLLAAITSFVCSGSPHSSSDTLSLVNSGHHTPRGTHLIGWFSGRRRSRLQPSMREFAVTASLCNDPKLAFSVAGGSESSRFSPRVFLIFSTPPTAPETAAIHTHEYKAYQFCPATEEFEPKSVSVVNIGPGFRGHYSNFSPNSPFPSMACELRGSSMMHEDEKLNVMLQAAKDKKELDMLVEGFEIGSLRRLMGPEAAAYTAGLEDMYEKMLAKISSLACQVEKSSVRVLELENQNSKLRADLAGIKRAPDT